MLILLFLHDIIFLMLPCQGTQNQLDLLLLFCFYFLNCLPLGTSKATQHFLNTYSVQSILHMKGEQLSPQPQVCNKWNFLKFSVIKLISSLNLQFTKSYRLNINQIGVLFSPRFYVPGVGTNSWSLHLTMLTSAEVTSYRSGPENLVYSLSVGPLSFLPTKPLSSSSWHSQAARTYSTAPLLFQGRSSASMCISGTWAASSAAIQSSGTRQGRLN